MLFIFHGSDTSTSYQAFQKLLASLVLKRPEASVFWLEPETFTADRLGELLKSQTLFAGRYLVAARRLLAQTEARELILANRQALKDSGHIFLLWEEKLDAKIKPLKHIAEQVKEYKLKVEPTPTPIFNLFALSDALGARDRKQLWLLLVEAQLAGRPAEEIYWRLFDQVKKMILIQSVDDPKVLTRPPFAYRPFYVDKLKRQAANFTLPELMWLIDELLAGYRRNRLGVGKLSHSLEQLAITI